MFKEGKKDLILVILDTFQDSSILLDYQYVQHTCTSNTNHCLLMAAITCWSKSWGNDLPYIHNMGLKMVIIEKVVLLSVLTTLEMCLLWYY